MATRSFSAPAFIGCALSILCSYDYHPTKKQEIKRLKAQGIYDVIIVPGVPYQDPVLGNILKARMLWAKYLFDNGVTENIIFSGSSVYNPYIEGKVMKIYADSLGIPSTHTFSETQAEHSTENIYYSALLAKNLGFKNIAVATDPYQTVIIKHFIKKNCPEIKIIPIEYDKLNLRSSSLPSIDPCTAYVDDFISLIERENRGKRFKGTLGKNIIVDSCDWEERQTLLTVEAINQPGINWSSYATSFISFFTPAAGSR